jgi:RES domain
MATFISPDSYRQFAQAVKHRTRYVHADELRDFLTAIMESSEARKANIKKSRIFWRAQRGYAWRTENAGAEDEFDVPAAFDAERMVPKAEFTSDGRVNPRGIPCLYLATTRETAMGEVRPWVGSYISLGQFTLTRDVTLVDCSRDKRLWPSWLLTSNVGEQFPAEKREQAIWGEINHALSRPVTPDDPVTEYVPTQILAEAFRAHGYDGIAYRSLLGDGLNVALFDCSAAELMNCCLYEAKDVKFTFEQRDNPYFVRKHYKELQEPTPKKKRGKADRKRKKRDV